MNGIDIYKLESIDDIKRFVIGGKAIITLESKTSGRWFTYKIKKAKKDDEKSPFFVSVLTGCDNEKSYAYMGTIFNNNNLVFRLTKKSNMGEEALSYKAFNLFFNLIQINKLHKDMNVYHRGVCGRCGKNLTVPESLVTGLGPECRGLVGKLKPNKIKNL